MVIQMNVGSSEHLSVRLVLDIDKTFRQVRPVVVVNDGQGGCDNFVLGYLFGDQMFTNQPDDGSFEFKGPSRSYGRGGKNLSPNS